MSASEHTLADLSGGAPAPARAPLFLPETLIIASAWLVTIAIALILTVAKGVPSPLRILLHEVGDNVNRNWYWVGTVLPANLVAIAAARSSSERVRIAAGATIIALACAALSAPFYDIKTAIYFGTKCCAIFGMLALVWQAKRPAGMERLLVVVMFATYLAIRLSYLPLTYMVRGDTFDLYTFAFDSSLGFNIAAFLFFLYHTFRPVAALLNAVYVFVLMSPLSLYAAQIYRRDPSTAPMLRVFITATMLGFVCYLVFPVSGPLYFLGSGEISQTLLTGPPHVMQFHASWRNGMPSVHFAIVLLMAINVPRSLRAAKVAFIGYCALTFMATMGNGEHYLADLVAALPFVCAVQGFCLWLNAPRLRKYLLAGLRSTAIFAGFLVFLIVAPEALRTPPMSWAILLLLVAHFLWERRGWWKTDAMADDSNVTRRAAPPPAALADGTDVRQPCNP